MTEIVQSAAPSVDNLRRWSLVRRRSVKRQNNLVGYFFISPWLIIFLLFTLAPMVISLGLAFTNYDILSDDYEYVGTANFERMREDIRYERSVKATFKYVSWVVPLRLSFALAIAMLLNTKRRGVYFYRAAFYAPSIVGGSVAVAVMWRQIFGNAGIVNAFLEILGLDTYRWLGDPTRAIWTLIILAVWQFGSPMLIFLAGLKQIPSELYEVASIDGANGFQKFRYVTLPLLTPIIFFNLIMQSIHAFRQFTQAFIVSGGTGRPLDTTLLYSLYLYQRAFVNFKMGYAAAMAWVMLLVIALLTLISFWLSRYWVFYETKES
ncbi:MAG: sugar ABC transporter permease [Chloroflexi bacterium]|nr:sugar ABC transporter permease [Chloroflexota bacterium]